MGRTTTYISLIAAAFCSSAIAVGQQGQGGRLNSVDSLQNLERALGAYLNGEEIKSVLTPGEFSEWTLNLKAGQVIVAEARSEAFDPALQIVDANGKVLAFNDDRFPGDQRPILMWTCEQDGAYAIHARCFHDKSGGQFFMRFNTYDSVDVRSGQMVDKEIDGGKPFLLRVPMKAGQIKTPVSEVGDGRRYARFQTQGVIAPGGLPDIDLARQISPINASFMAPVDGEYYVLAHAYREPGKRVTIRAGVREIVAQPLAKQGSEYLSTAGTNTPGLWVLPVKAGELIEVSMPELNLNPRNVLAEVPDISKFAIDPKKPELNPFFPQPQENRPPDKGPAYEILPGRVRDGRLFVFFVRRDTNLWIATDGSGKPDSKYTLHIRPAAANFTAGEPNVGKLRIGNTDYWAFDAKAGDVMTLNSRAEGFAQRLIVRGPDLEDAGRHDAEPDEMTFDWKMIIQRPGRYLVGVSCLGDGGGGEYTLSRQVLHAKEFSKATPAKAEIADGQIQIWKFTASPDDPLLVRWRSEGWSYDAAIYDENGRPSDFQRLNIDDKNQFGILKVNKPQTFVIVLTGRGGKSSYSIELNDLPGYKGK